MSSPLILATLLTAAVLLLSGVAKLREPQATRDAFSSLRLPGALARLGAPAVLPWAELALAAGLLLLPGAPAVVVAVIVVLLMLTYAALIARALGFPEPVDCSCFGTLGAGRVTRLTLTRNILLVMTSGLATLDLARADGSVVQRLVGADRHTWEWLGMSAIAAVLAAIIFDRGGESETVDQALDGDDEYVRLPIPYGSLEKPDGQMVSLKTMVTTQARLLAFLNESCGPCVRAQTFLAPFAEANPEVGVVGIYREWANRDAIPQDVDWYIDNEGSLMQAFGVHGTPAAILLGADGLTAGGPVRGEEAIQQFLDDIAAELAEQRAAAVEVS